MKKLTALLLSAALILSLAACGSSSNTVTTVSTTAAPTEQTAVEATETVASAETEQEIQASGGKILVVYYSASSGMGRSGSLLAEMAGAGTWQDGQRFSSSVSTADVQNWVSGLGL